MKMLRLEDEFINPLEVTKIDLSRLPGSNPGDTATTLRMRDGSRIPTEHEMHIIAAAVGIAASDDSTNIGFWMIDNRGDIVWRTYQKTYLGIADEG